MRNVLLLSLGLLVSDAEASMFDDLSKPENYKGFTVTVEYDPNEDTKVIRKFYEEIMNSRANFNYYKVNDSALDKDKLPAVIVRCENNIVYDSYGRTPPSLLWNLAINYFTGVLDKKSNKCS